MRRRYTPLWQAIVLPIALAGWLGVAAPASADQIAQKGDPHDAAPAETSRNRPLAPGDDRAPDPFEIRSVDGSRLKVRLLDAKIPLETRFGRLSIPAADIHQIDFATRLSDDVAKRVATVIKELASDEYNVREAASAELLSLETAAYPALLVAAESDDAEVARRAELLLQQIRRAVSADDLETRAEDLVYTEKSQIAGTIDLESLNVETTLFGRQQVDLVLLRRLSARSQIDEVPGPVLPDPGTLDKYRGKIGAKLYFRIVAPQAGVQRGAVWGTDIYTYDSSLVMAALHAGIVAPGETKVVGVTILGAQNTFGGSPRNGILSAQWGPYPSAFRFITNDRAPRNPAAAPGRP